MKKKNRSTGPITSEETESIIKDPSNKENLGAKEIDGLVKSLLHKSGDWSLVSSSHIKSWCGSHVNTGKTEAVGFLGPTGQPVWPN